MRLRVGLAIVLSFAMASVSLADVIDINGSTGEVTGWGVTPFSVASPAEGVSGGVAFTLHNDYAPIKYPSGVGRVPSPGLSAGGEAIDLEEMYVRTTGGQIQVLVVTSTAYGATFSGVDYYLGDLFITADGQRYAVVTQSANEGLAAGSLYRIDSDGDVVELQAGARSYAGSTTVCENDYGPDATVPEIAGPWAVDGDIDAAQLLGSAGIDTATFDYGDTEDGTFLIEYTLDLSLFGPTAPVNVDTHMTWGCGNDVIKVRDVVVPEPATMALVGLGLGAMLIRQPRKK